MPATVIGSAEWNTRGIVLSRQTSQEQVNGLVNVQVEYSIPASKQYQIDRMFYVDAPPPIWPTVVNRAEMLTNNLYMVNRSVSRGNGLIIVNAEYVSGLNRGGFRGYFLRESIETGKRGQAYTYGPNPGGFFNSIVGVLDAFSFLGERPQLLSKDARRALIFESYSAVSYNYSRGQWEVTAPNASIKSVRSGLLFAFDERIITIEFIQIGGARAAQMPTITRADVASVVFQSGSSSQQQVSSADLWVAPGPLSFMAQGILSFEKDTPVPYTVAFENITSSVQIVTQTYRLSR